MSALFKKHLSRRTFIRGVGVTMSLPFLDAMVPVSYTHLTLPTILRV